MSDPRCVDVSMSSTVHCMVSCMIKHLSVMNMYSTSSPLSCDVCFKTMLLAALVAHSFCFLLVSFCRPLFELTCLIALPHVAQEALFFSNAQVAQTPRAPRMECRPTV